MDAELICGIYVKKIPEKPDYLPISQEEFEQNTLAAWCASMDEKDRTAAVFHGGPREWKALCHDSSVSVRAALACRAPEPYQHMLVGDPDPRVRQRLAIYSTDKVRGALLSHGETDPDVLAEIARYGSTAIRRRLVDAAWDSPEALRRIARYLPSNSIERLLTHPSMEVRMDAAVHGSMEQCRRVLDMPCPAGNVTLLFMRDGLIERMRELDEVANAIHSGKSKMRTRKIEHMELSVLTN